MTQASSVNAKSYEAAAPQSVAFLGLGVMGYPMAGHLARAGHRVTVYNRSSAKAQAWLAEFGATASTLGAHGQSTVLEQLVLRGIRVVERPFTD